MLARGAHLLRLQTNRGYRIPSRPEACSIAVSLSSTTLSRHGDGTLALDIPNHLGHRILRRNADEHVDMILHPMPCHDRAPALPSQCTHHGTKKAPHLAIPRFLPPLRDKDHVIFTIPLCVA